MLAVRVRRYGGPDELQLEDIAIPEPASGEALVRVHAAGVGPWDALVRTGKSGLPQTLPLTPGSDIAGIVERIDAPFGATSLAAGDEVYGVTNASFTGGYAQYAVVSLHSLARKPTTLGYLEAASVPVVAVTAWQMLFDRAQVVAGQTVLVHGGAGNVGAYAVQLARWAGARVIATARADDAEYVRHIGAVQILDTDESALAQVQEVDAVIDTIGGDVQTHSFPLLTRGGIIVSSVSMPSEELTARYGVRGDYFIVDVTAAQLNTVAKLIDEGALTTDLGIVLALADAARAHQMLAGTLPHPRGKIVLDIPSKETP